MRRRALAAALAVAGLVLAVLAARQLSPRGLQRSVWASNDWEGPTTLSDVVDDLDFGPDMSRHRWTLPGPGTLELSGYLLAPQQGDYAFVVDSTDAVWLEVGGAPVVTHNAGRPPVTGTTFLERGLHPFRVRLLHRSGVSDLAVSWAPPGVSEPVILSPFFLVPSPPSGDPAAVNLGVGAGLCLLIALGLLVVPRLRRSPGLTAGLVATAVALALLLPIALLAEETRDEASVALASRAAVGNLVHGIVHSAYWGLGSRNPPVGYFLYGAASFLMRTDALWVLRVVAALCTAATVGFVTAFGVARLGLRTAAAGALILVTCPALLGIGTLATLDAPALLTLTLAVLHTIAAFESPRPNRALLGAGLWAGLAMATRLSGVLVLAFAASLHLARAVLDHRRSGTTLLPLGLLGAPALAACLTFLLWPWLWRSPFGQLLLSLGQWDYGVSERFLGSTGALPPAYLPVQLVVTTPALWLVAMVLGAARRPRPEPAPPSGPSVGALLLLWAATPFWGMASDVTADGARHLLPALPPLALLGAHGFQTLRISERVRTSVLVAGAAWALSQVAALTPYVTEYRSELVGGVQGAWATDIAPPGLLAPGVTQAAQLVRDVVEPTTTVRLDGAPWHLVSGILPPVVQGGARPEIWIRCGVGPGNTVLEGYLIINAAEVDGVPLVQLALRDGGAARRRYDERVSGGKPPKP